MCQFTTAQSARFLLLVSAIYARQLNALLDSLPAARLVELADVCHRFSCDILDACGEALVRKVERDAWLTPVNALSVLGWAGSRGLDGLRQLVAEYAACHTGALVIDEKAAVAGADLALLLQCQQRQLRGRPSGSPQY